MSDGRRIILLGVVILYLGSLAGGNDYCAMRCDGGPHTMCHYKEGGPSHCDGYELGLSSTEKRLIVQFHNKMRQGLAQGKEESQPPAANMKLMSWDPELASIAQRWADQCTKKGNDKCRATLDGTFVGQNIAEKNGYVSTCRTVFRAAVVEAVKGWYDEVVNLDNTTVNAFVPGRTDQYAQMVWANTTKVGCGAIYICSRNSYFLRFVCNYKPRGNYDGQPIYIEGDACTRCPKGTRCDTKWTGLCKRSKH